MRRVPEYLRRPAARARAIAFVRIAVILSFAGLLALHGSGTGSTSTASEPPVALPIYQPVATAPAQRAASQPARPTFVPLTIMTPTEAPSPILPPPSSTPVPSPMPSSTRTAVPEATPRPLQPLLAEPTATPVSAVCPTAIMPALAQSLFDAVNNERTQRGLPALAVDGCVVYVAQFRSDDMAARGYFSHQSPEGATAFSLLGAQGIGYQWAGEDLARNNYPDGEAEAIAIRDWMASQGHREVILSTRATHLGVGLAVDGAGTKYFTAIFIERP